MNIYYTVRNLLKLKKFLHYRNNGKLYEIKNIFLEIRDLGENLLTHVTVKGFNYPKYKIFSVESIRIFKYMYENIQ